MGICDTRLKESLGVVTHADIISLSTLFIVCKENIVLDVTQKKNLNIFRWLVIWRLKKKALRPFLSFGKRYELYSTEHHVTQFKSLCCSISVLAEWNGLAYLLLGSSNSFFRDQA